MVGFIFEDKVEKEISLIRKRRW